MITRIVTTVGAVVALVGALLVGAPLPSEAASRGVGYNIGQGFLGAYVTESDGRNVYCLDSAAPAPLNTTSAPQDVSSLTSYSGDVLGPDVLARLNYALTRWGQTGDPHWTAALAMYVWSLADADTYDSHGQSGDTYYVFRAPASERSTILANLATIRVETEGNYVIAPRVELSIAMTDHYNGMLTVVVDPPSLIASGSVVLSNATFEDGSSSKSVGSGTYPIRGTPPVSAPSYSITATAGYGSSGRGGAVALYTTPGGQRLLGGATSSSVTDAVTTEEIRLDFQPSITTDVAWRYVPSGGSFADLVDVSTVGVGEWIQFGGDPVQLMATGRLYGPFAERPTEAPDAPADAPVFDTETLAITGGPLTYVVTADRVAVEPGFYTWVWEIDRGAQGVNAQYLRGSFRDWFGRSRETHVVPFQPVATTQADPKIATPGNEMRDTIMTYSTDGPWLRIDGEPIPVVYDGTAYLVNGPRPPLVSELPPATATPIDNVQITATGPGYYTSPPVTLPGAAFVTWVWEVRLESQPLELRQYIAEAWSDRFGLPFETTSLRHPVQIESEVREYNVHLGGRIFDEVVLSGFPADHGDFTGDGYWSGDVDEVTHTVYGPFATDTELTEDLDLAAAPVLVRLTTPARNGTYELGYTDADLIRPTAPGYYVVVSDFVGDDRVQPFRTSPADIRERVYVAGPSPTTEEFSLRTEAAPTAWVGEWFGDVAIIDGTVPEGAQLTFGAYGPFTEEPTETDDLEPFYVSEPVPVDGPGRYPSGLTRVDRPGLVYWVAIIVGADGNVLAEGSLGDAGELTLVRARPEPPVPDEEDEPRLALTGGAPIPIAVGAGALVLGAGLIAWGRMRRPARHRA